MRISQLKTLCWMGNLLILAGVGWTVLQFVDAYEARAQRVEVTWPGEDRPVRGIERRWPGEVAAFTHIWQTPVDGEIPKPPEETGPVVDKRTAAEIFKQATFFRGGILHDDPVLSVVRIERDGEIQHMLVGESVAGWQLVDVQLGSEGPAVAVFQSLDPGIEDLVRLDEEILESELVGDDTGPFTAIPLDDDPNKPIGPDPERTRIRRQAVRDVDDANRWYVPPEEVRWWQRWGESEVLAKTSLATKTDADGTPIGLEVRSAVGAGTPVARGRGIYQGDVIKSVNGTPITSEEDLLRYLRGPGKGVDRFEVVVENAGRERTMVYRFTSR